MNDVESILSESEVNNTESLVTVAPEDIEIYSSAMLGLGLTGAVVMISLAVGAAIRFLRSI